MHRSLFINAAIVLSFLITAALLGYFYHSLPAIVPLFVSPAGEVTRVAPKSPLTVFRLWLMGVSAQCLCVTLSLSIRRKPESCASRVLRSAVEEFFSPVNSILSQGWNEDFSEYDLDAERTFGVALAVLEDLSVTGVFGSGAQRSKLTVNLFKGDQSEAEREEWATRLNRTWRSGG